MIRLSQQNLFSKTIFLNLIRKLSKRSLELLYLLNLLFHTRAFIWPNLQFTYESLKKRVASLDLNVSLENGTIITDLYVKSTDCPQYLHCSYSRKNRIKNFIIFSQTLRLSNIFAHEEDFDKHVLNMKPWFL